VRTLQRGSKQNIMEPATRFTVVGWHRFLAIFILTQSIPLFSIRRLNLFAIVFGISKGPT